MRSLLKQILNSLKQKKHGFIVRTVGEKRDKEEFESDVNFLLGV